MADKTPKVAPKAETQHTQADGTSVPGNINALNPQSPQPPKPEPAHKDEGTYVDPATVPPNPNPELHPNMQPKVSEVPRPDLIAVNDHQVHPELYYGTTPTDPDIRHRGDNSVTKEEQTAEMARRASSEYPDEKAPIDKPIKELEELRSRQPVSGSPVPNVKRPKAASVKVTPQDGKMYKIRDDTETSWWWQRKYDKMPLVLIEGRVSDVVSAGHGSVALGYDSNLQQVLQDRTGVLPADSIILKNYEKELYYGVVQGHRQYVHAAELDNL